MTSTAETLTLAERLLVFRRARGRCEACAESDATEVHHTSYDHVGNEPLWELRAVCRTCHAKITTIDRDGRAVVLSRLTAAAARIGQA